MSRWLDSDFIAGMEQRMAGNAHAKDMPGGWPDGGRPRASAVEHAKKVARHLTRYLILADNGMSDVKAVALICRAAFNAASSIHKDEPEPPNAHLVAIGCNAMCLHRIDRLEGEKAKEE